MTAYHYTECGLDNVFIDGINPCKDDDGDEIVVIPAVAQLHKVIAQGLAEKPSKLSGNELRFLRTEMGMTQTQLADMVHVKMLTVSRWERDENEIDANAEMVIRLLADDILGLGLDLKVRNLSESAGVEPPVGETIRVDGAQAKSGEYSVRVA